MIPNVSYDNEHMHYRDMYSDKLFLRIIVNNENFPVNYPAPTCNLYNCMFLCNKNGEIIKFNNAYIIGYQFDPSNNVFNNSYMFDGFNLTSNSSKIRNIDVNNFTALYTGGQFNNIYCGPIYLDNTIYSFSESYSGSVLDPTGLNVQYSWNGKSATGGPYEWATFSFEMDGITYTSNQLNSGEIKIRLWRLSDTPTQNEEE